MALQQICLIYVSLLFWSASAIKWLEGYLDLVRHDSVHMEGYAMECYEKERDGLNNGETLNSRITPTEIRRAKLSIMSTKNSLGIPSNTRRLSYIYTKIGLGSKIEKKYSSLNIGEDYVWRKSDCTKENLSGRLARFCRKNMKEMAFFPTSIAKTKYHCKEQFRFRRWDCTTIDKSHFGVDLREDTRESAFVHALFSASLAHSVAKACMDGKISGCSCAKKPAYLPEGKRLDEVRFSSCTNFLSVGIRFAGRFADAGFRRKKRHIRLISSVLKHHNSKIGRESLLGPDNVHCRCHGVSGNCAVKSCWKRLPFMRSVASKLRDLYDTAYMVVYDNLKRKFVSKWLQMNIGKKDLIYGYESPNYCIANATLGVYGTQGRSCNHTASGYHSCEVLCCGRGVRIQRTEVIERCRCKYVWCCDVKCKECRRTYDEYICK